MSTFEPVYILGVDGPDGAGKTCAIDAFFKEHLRVQMPDADIVIGPFRVYDAQDGHAVDLWVMRQVYPSWLPTGWATRRYLSGTPPLRLDHQQSLLCRDFWAGELQQYAAANRAWRSWMEWCRLHKPLGLDAPGALLIVCDRTPLSMLAYNGAQIQRVEHPARVHTEASAPPYSSGVDADTAYMVLQGNGHRVRLPHHTVLLLPPDEVLALRVSSKRTLNRREHLGHNDTVEGALARKIAFTQAAADPKLRGRNDCEVTVLTQDPVDLLYYTPWRRTAPTPTDTTTTTDTQEESP